jgi:hypothetical protein
MRPPPECGNRQERKPGIGPVGEQNVQCHAAIIEILDEGCAELAQPGVMS